MVASRKQQKKIFVSQPTLSRSIKNLETKLKVDLFERSTRKLILTDAGILVYQ
ncbi:LysR family transcriptional regulator [Oceanobacillus zhaokaii]|nr:LysR family transcriptional regulator [Oceanobacillus zhaokaii]